MSKTVLIIVFVPFLVGSSCKSNNDAYVASGFSTSQNGPSIARSVQILEVPNKGQLGTLVTK